jgi:CubicO group peptidase (beta-lactamase class C family)
MATITNTLISRRNFGLMTAGGCLAVAAGNQGVMAAGAPGDGLPRARAEDQGVEPAAVMAFLNALEAEQLEMNSFMLSRGGKVVAEGWWYPYRAEIPHMMHSLTKSVMACAVGLALAEKRFALSDKVVSFFPEHLPAEVSDNLKAMTVEHLLTMRCGHAKETSGSVWRPIKTSWIAEFFKIPVELAPDSKFVYTSAASYMLSAIVTKTTGQTVRDYLEPRVFQPLGITGLRWDVSPDNVSPGGNGLTWRTSDITKLCMLHAQGGMWNGKQILPADWIAAATKRQSGNERYGYQWWVSPADNYYADGKFSQIGLVFTQNDAVLAFTAANNKGRRCVELAEKHLTEGFKPAPIPQDDAAWNALKTRIESLRLLAPMTSSTSPLEKTISGRRFDVEPNEDGVEAVSFTFAKGRCLFTLRDGRGTHTISAGLDFWTEGSTSMTGGKLHHEYEQTKMPVVAGAMWTSPNTLEMVWQFVESSFRDHVICRFDGPNMTLDRSVNVNSAALNRPTLTAHMKASRL